MGSVETELDVRGSVHHNTIHKEKTNKMQQCIQILLLHIYMKLNMLRWHTANHQEPKIALAASDVSYMEGCWAWSWWTLSGTVCLTTSTNYTSDNLPRMKNRGCQCSFRLMMMGGVSPETCWGSYKHVIIKFDTLLHLVGFFFMNCSMMHGSMNVKFEILLVFFFFPPEV